MNDLLHAIFVGLDHLLDHLATNGTCLTAGKITIIAVLQVNTNLSGGPLTILKSVFSALCRLIFYNFRPFAYKLIVDVYGLLIGDFSPGCDNCAGRITLGLDFYAVYKCA